VPGDMTCRPSFDLLATAFASRKLPGPGLARPADRYTGDMADELSKGRTDLLVAPDFIVIGAQRGGTTWMQRRLIEHPEVFVPAWRTDDIFLDADAMSGHHDEPVVGVFDATLLTRSEVPKDIKALSTSVKLLAVVRNPVDRAYSWYHIRLRQGDGLYEAEPSFAEALEADPQLVSNGIYTPHLKRYIDVVGKNRLWIGVFDDLRADPLQFLTDVLHFLGIEETTDLPSHWAKSVNYSAAVQNRRLHRLARRAKRGTRRVLGMRNQWLVDRLEQSRIVTSFKRANERVVPPLDEATRSILFERFADDIAELEQLLGRDLSRWKPRGAR